MRRRVLGWAAGAVLLAALVWWQWPDARQGEGGDAPRALTVDASSDLTVPSSSGKAPPSVPVEILLLPHGYDGAVPASVRIGLGIVPPDQARAYTRWVEAGEDGAGPDDYADLAQIEGWVTPPTSTRPDQTVVVGPMSLERADRYDLRARGADPLVSYAASFTATSIPGTVAPTLAAGLRVTSPTTVDSRVLFRRVGESIDPARWQALLAEQAPELLAAYDEAALPLTAPARFAPLPPGPLEVVLVTRGVEAERQRVELVAGTWTEVRFDAVSDAVARAVATDLELHFVRARSTDPIPDLSVTWHADRGDQLQLSDVRGTLRFTELDRQRRQRFTIQFPRHSGDLPTWPESQPLELTLDDADADADAGDDRTTLVRKTIELQPLRWLDLRTGDLQLPMHRQGGQPYPIFVLQQERSGVWADVAADHFLPVVGGLAVSVQHDGRYRVMALQSPWSVRYSTVATVSPGHDARQLVSLPPAAGHRVDVTVLRDGIPLATAPVALRGPARGLPGATVMTDAAGRLVLDDATAPQIQLEVPGFLAEVVDLDGTTARIELKPDPEVAEP